MKLNKKQMQLLLPHVAAGLPRHWSREKSDLYQQVQIWVANRGLVLEPEYCFAKPRRWRFDLAFPDHLVAIEYQGTTSGRVAGHQTRVGLTKDTEKHNAAMLLGWRVVYVTALNYKQWLGWVEPLIFGKGGAE